MGLKEEKKKKVLKKLRDFQLKLVNYQKKEEELYDPVTNDFVSIDRFRIQDTINFIETHNSFPSSMIAMINEIYTKYINMNCLGVPKEIYNEIVSFLENNRKIYAIKLYRDTTQKSLKESKDAIENFYKRTQNCG